MKRKDRCWQFKRTEVTANIRESSLTKREESCYREPQKKNAIKDTNESNVHQSLLLLTKKITQNNQNACNQRNFRTTTHVQSKAVVPIFKQTYISSMCSAVINHNYLFQLYTIFSQVLTSIYIRIISIAKTLLLIGLLISNFILLTLLYATLIVALKQ